MSEQAKAVGVSDKMKAKDYITLGIFTVLFFAVVMVCIFASAATVVTFALPSSLSGSAGTIKRNCLKNRLTQSWLLLTRYRNTWKA